MVPVLFIVMVLDNEASIVEVRSRTTSATIRSDIFSNSLVMHTLDNLIYGLRWNTPSIQRDAFLYKNISAMIH